MSSEMDKVLETIPLQRRLEAQHILHSNSSLRGRRYLESDAKRAFDYGVTILPALFSLPVIGLSGLYIYGTDGYRSWPFVDVGRKDIAGAPGYSFWKTRTMIPNARLDESRHLKENHPEALDIAFNKNKNPRITKQGQKLRDTNIDELAQLLNVLRPDDNVSLVGPRPPSLLEWEGIIFSGELEGKEPYLSLMNHVRGKEVRWGVTGFYFIFGRSAQNPDSRFALDVWYLKEATLKADFVILYKTLQILTGLKRR